MFSGRRQPSCDGTSRMMRECQVRICERLGVKFPGPTRHSRPRRTKPHHDPCPLRPESGQSFGFTPAASSLGEGGHRVLARRLVAVSWHAIFMMPKRQRPHPWHSYRRRVGFENAADNDAVRQHVIVVIIPFARRTACCRSFKDQLGHVIDHFVMVITDRLAKYVHRGHGGA
jgi:hypothetical protein